MNFDPKSYKAYAKLHEKKSPVLKNAVFAFLIGGAICLGAQGLLYLYTALGASEEDAKLWVSISLIFFSALFTGIGIYDKIAKVAGAGTLVPITGFANAVASPALDTKAEGFVLGIGAKIFTVAGPVILYGTLASVLCGILFWGISVCGGQI